MLIDEVRVGSIVKGKANQQASLSEKIFRVVRIDRDENLIRVKPLTSGNYTAFRYYFPSRFELIQY